MSDIYTASSSPYDLDIQGSNRLAQADPPLAALRTMGQRMQILASNAPWLANNTFLLSTLASTPLDDMALADSALTLSASMDYTSFERWFTQQDPQRQRTAWMQLTGAQQQMLANNGKAPDLKVPEHKGSFLPDLGIVSTALSIPTTGIKKAWHLTEESLLVSQNTINSAYRVMRSEQGVKELAILGGAVAGSVLASRIPVVGEVFTGVSGRVVGGLLAGQAATLAVKGPVAYTEAWKQAWDGERFFTKSSMRDAAAYLEGHPELMDLLTKLSDEPFDVLEGFAGRRNPEVTKIRDAAVYELSLRHGPDGSDQQRQAAAALQEAADDPNFQQAIHILHSGKISPGRDLARILPWNDHIVSGAVDGVWSFVADPFMMSGKVVAAKNLARRGIFAEAGAMSTAPSLVERVRSIASQGAVQDGFEVVADALNKGEKGRLWAQMPEWRTNMTGAYEVWWLNKTGGGVPHTAASVEEWFKDGAGLAELIAGQGASWRKGYISFPAYTRLNAARWRASDWASSTISFASEVKVKGLGELSPGERFDDIELARYGLTREQVEARVTAAGRHQMTAKAFDAIGQVPMLRSVTAWGGSFVRGLTTQLPREGFVRLGAFIEPGTGLVTSPDYTGLRNFLRMYRHTGMTDDVAEQWFNFIAGSDSLAGRMMAIRQFQQAALEGAGVGFTAEGRKVIDDLLHSFDQRYGLDDLDKITVNGLTYRRGILPQADLAHGIAVPDFRELRRAVNEHNVLSTVLNVADSKFIEAYMTRVWKPATILRFGFILRAGGEEALSVIARIGISSYLQTQAYASFMHGELDDQPYLAGTRYLARLNGYIANRTPPWLHYETFEQYADQALRNLADHGRRFMDRNFWNDGIVGHNPSLMEYRRLLEDRSPTFKAWLNRPQKIGRTLLRGFTPEERMAMNNLMKSSVYQRGFAQSISAQNHGLVDAGKDLNKIQVVVARQGRTSNEVPVMAVRGGHVVTGLMDADPFFIAGVAYDMSRPVTDDIMIARAYLQVYPNYVSPRTLAAIHVMAGRMGLPADDVEQAFKSLVAGLDSLKKIDPGLHAVVMELFNSSGSDAHLVRTLSRSFGNRSGGVAFIRRMRRYNGVDGFEALRNMWTDPFLAPLRSRTLDNGLTVEEFVRKLADADPNIDLHGLRRWLPLHRDHGTSPFFTTKAWQEQMDEAFRRQLKDPANQKWVQGQEWALHDTVSGLPVLTNQLPEGSRALYAPLIVQIRPELAVLSVTDPEARLGDALRALLDSGAINEPIDGSMNDLLDIANNIKVADFLRRLDEVTMPGPAIPGANYSQVPVAFSDPDIARRFAKLVNAGDGADRTVHVLVSPKAGGWPQPGSVDPAIGRFVAKTRSDGLGPPLRMWDVKEDFPYLWRPVQPNMTFHEINGEWVPGVTQEMALDAHAQVLRMRTVQLYQVEGRGALPGIEMGDRPLEGQVGGGSGPPRTFAGMDLPPETEVRTDWSAERTHVHMEDGQNVIVWNPGRVSRSWGDFAERVGEPRPYDPADDIVDLTDPNGFDEAPPLEEGARILPGFDATASVEQGGLVPDKELADLRVEQNLRMNNPTIVETPGTWDKAQSRPVALARIEAEMEKIYGRVTAEMAQKADEHAGPAFSEVANRRLIEDEAERRIDALGLRDHHASLKEEIEQRKRIGELLDGELTPADRAEIAYRRQVVRFQEDSRYDALERNRLAQELPPEHRFPEQEVRIKGDQAKRDDMRRRHYQAMRNLKEQWQRAAAREGARERVAEQVVEAVPRSVEPDDYFHEGLLRNVADAEQFMTWAEQDIPPPQPGFTRLWRISYVDSQGKLLGWDGRLMTRSLGHGWVWSNTVEAAEGQAGRNPYFHPLGPRRSGFNPLTPGTETRLSYIDVPDEGTRLGDLDVHFDDETAADKLVSEGNLDKRLATVLGDPEKYSVGAHWRNEVELRRLIDEHITHMSWFSSHSVDEQTQYFLEPWGWGKQVRNVRKWPEHLAATDYGAMPQPKPGFTRVWRAEASLGEVYQGDRSFLKVVRTAPPVGKLDKATGVIQLDSIDEINARITVVEERLSHYHEGASGINTQKLDIAEEHAKLKFELERLKNSLNNEGTQYTAIEGNIWSPDQKTARRQLYEGRSKSKVGAKADIRFYYMDVPDEQLAGRTVAEIKKGWLDNVLAKDRVQADIGISLTSDEVRKARYVRKTWDPLLEQWNYEPVTYRASHYERNYNRYGFQGTRGKGQYLIDDPGASTTIRRRIPATRENIDKMRRYMAGWNAAGDNANPLGFRPDVLARYRRLEGEASIGPRTGHAVPLPNAPQPYVDGWGHLHLAGDGIALHPDPPPGATAYRFDRDMVDQRPFTPAEVPAREGMTRIWRTRDGQWVYGQTREEVTTLPPVPEGHVRLYRHGGLDLHPDTVEWIRQNLEAVEGGVPQGRWWTDKPEHLDYYKADNPEGKTWYMDVPANVAEQYRGGVKGFTAVGMGDNEFFLPRNLLDRAHPMTTVDPEDILGYVDVDENVAKRWKYTDAKRTTKKVPDKYVKHVQMGEKLDGDVVVPAGFWEKLQPTNDLLDRLNEVAPPEMSMDEVNQRIDILERVTQEGSTPGAQPKWRPDLQEIWRRLGVDEKELFAWFQQNGGINTWAKFILAHELGHISAGHVGADALAGIAGNAGEVRYLRETIAMDHAFERLNMPFGSNRARHVVGYDPTQTAQRLFDDLRINTDDPLQVAEEKLAILSDMAHRRNIDLPAQTAGMAKEGMFPGQNMFTGRELTPEELAKVREILARHGVRDDLYVYDGMTDEHLYEWMNDEADRLREQWELSPHEDPTVRMDDDEFERYLDQQKANGMPEEDVQAERDYRARTKDQLDTQMDMHNELADWYQGIFPVERPAQAWSRLHPILMDDDLRRIAENLTAEDRGRINTFHFRLGKVSRDALPPTIDPDNSRAVMEWFDTGQVYREGTSESSWNNWSRVWDDNAFLREALDGLSKEEAFDSIVQMQLFMPTRLEPASPEFMDEFVGPDGPAFPGMMTQHPGAGDDITRQLGDMLAFGRGHAPYTMDNVHTLLQGTDAPDEWFRRSMAQMKVRVGGDDMPPVRTGLIDPPAGTAKIANDFGAEVRWEVLAPLLQDAADQHAKDVVFRNGSVVTRHRPEHVHDLGDKMPRQAIRPDWQIAEDYRVNPTTGKLERARAIDRFTDEAFALIGRGVDALARQPLALHLYMQGYMQGLAMNKWLLDPTIMGRGGQAILGRGAPDEIVTLFNDHWRTANALVDEIGANAAMGDPEFHDALAAMDRLTDEWPGLVLTEPGSARQMVDRWQNEVNDIAASIAADPALRPVLDWVAAQVSPAARSFRWQELAEAYATDPTTVRGTILDLEKRFPTRLGDLEAVVNALDEHAIAVTDPDTLLTRINFEWSRHPRFARMTQTSFNVKDLPPWFAKRIRGGDIETLHAVREAYAAVEPAIGDIAMNRAIADSIPFIDDHAVRSQFQEHVRNLIPFWFAEEQFLKRWARTLRVNPMFMRKAQLVYMGLKESGTITQDENGQDIFYLPVVGPVAEYLTSIPWLGLRKGGVPALPGGVGLGLAIRPQDMLPGFNRVGAPTAGPVVGIPLRLLSNVLPELKGVEAGLMGQDNLSRGYMQMVMPRPVVQAWEAWAEDEDSSRQMASQMTTTELMLESTGHGLPDDATSTDIQINIDRVRNYSRNLGVLRFVAGFFSPGATRPTFTNSTEWGMSAQRFSIQPELIQLVRTHGWEVGSQKFMERYPDANVWTVFATDTVSGAIVPSTAEAWGFYESNKTLLKQYPDAGPWLLPPAQGDDFSSRAFGEMMAEGLRQRLGPTDYWRALKFAEASKDYFESVDRYRQVSQAQTGQIEKQLLTIQWDLWRKDYLATHPIFAEELTSAEGRQRRARVLTQLTQIVTDPAAPQPWHMQGIRDLIQSYNRYKNVLAGLAASRRTVDELAKEQVKLQFKAWGEQYVSTHPEVEHLWFSVIKPESYLESVNG